MCAYTFSPLFAALATALAPAAFAEPPQIVAATAVAGISGWRVDVTLRHDDTGWGHYADAWRVEDAAGTVLGTRILVHPHVTEQPFTRSLSGIALPKDLTELHVRARCLTDGWTEETQVIPLH